MDDDYTFNEDWSGDWGFTFKSEADYVAAVEALQQRFRSGEGTQWREMSHGAFIATPNQAVTRRLAAYLDDVEVEYKLNVDFTETPPGVAAQSSANFAAANTKYGIAFDTKQAADEAFKDIMAYYGEEGRAAVKRYQQTFLSVASETWLSEIQDFLDAAGIKYSVEVNLDAKGAQVDPDEVFNRPKTNRAMPSAGSSSKRMVPKEEPTEVPYEQRLKRAIDAKNEEAIISALKGKMRIKADTILDIYGVAQELRSNKLMNLVRSLKAESVKRQANSLVKAVLEKYEEAYSDPEAVFSSLLRLKQKFGGKHQIISALNLTSLTSGSDMHAVVYDVVSRLLMATTPDAAAEILDHNDDIEDQSLLDNIAAQINYIAAREARA